LKPLKRQITDPGKTKVSNNQCNSNFMTTGPGEDAEFLKRKEALIPIRQKRFSRKRKNPSRNRKPGCRREAEGVQYPVWIYRKVMKHRFAAR
jgi:hypothetical protein